jgi:hypothetical protein
MSNEIVCASTTITNCLQITQELFLFWQLQKWRRYKNFDTWRANLTQYKDGNFIENISKLYDWIPNFHRRSLQNNTQFIKSFRV